MKRVFTTSAVLLALAASAASAQYTSQPSYGTAPASKADIVVLGGYAFTLSQDVYPVGVPAGEIDMDDAAFYGVALDFNVARQGDKHGQLRLLWRREDSEIVYRPYAGGGGVSIDGAIEYWQIGGVGGMRRGNAMPFTSVTLGGTRLVGEDGDAWKFSMIFGLGVKIYTQGKFGFMIQGNWPITFTDTWGGVTVGTGGAGVAIGGTGISQIDIGGGIVISL